jgi:hypothetical protein
LVQDDISSNPYQQKSSVQQPTDFNYKIRENMFGPLKFPSFLHPYPPGFVHYLPTFAGKDNTVGEEHLSDFQDFIDKLEILHEDVVMRLLSKSLVRDVALWLKNVETASIKSWDELFFVFLKH